MGKSVPPRSGSVYHGDQKTWSFLLIIPLLWCNQLHQGRCLWDLLMASSWQTFLVMQNQNFVWISSKYENISIRCSGHSPRPLETCSSWNIAKDTATEATIGTKHLNTMIATVSNADLIIATDTNTSGPIKLIWTRTIGTKYAEELPLGIKLWTLWLPW